jgi:hypothetical protein
MDVSSSKRNVDAESDKAAEKALGQLIRKFNRSLERDLRKERPRLFEALAEFANVRSDRKAWSHFRKRWPNFFSKAEYERAEGSVSRSVRDYPRWLHHVWLGNPAPLLQLLGIKAEPQMPGDTSQLLDIHLIPAQFFADWDEGIFRYRGMCNFQRALYLLFRESWRARVCERCSAKFIARRVAQRYCMTDCSEAIQRELKRRWWAEHGETWRQERKVVKSKKKGGKNGARKTR